MLKIFHAHLFVWVFDMVLDSLPFMTLPETTIFRTGIWAAWSCVQFFQRQDELDIVPEPKKPKILSRYRAPDTRWKLTRSETLCTERDTESSGSEE